MTHKRQIRSRMTGARSSLLRRRSVLAAIVAMGAVAPAFVVAAPANADYHLRCIGTNW
jgi:hypothetical protein